MRLDSPRACLELAGLISVALLLALSACDGSNTKGACSKCRDSQICNFGKCTEVDITFPEDAGPHSYETEWWYYTGHLFHGNDRFGFEVTVFSYDVNGVPAYMCHVGFTDEAETKHYHWDGITFEAREWSSKPVTLDVMNCRLSLSGDGNDEILGIIPDGEERDGNPGQWKIELSFVPLKKPAVHGGNGIIDMSDQGGTSWYYSYTRLSAGGTIETPRTGRIDVTGIAWMDHQWGDFNVSQFKGWDWWSVQTDDYYEIMLFKFRDWDNRPAGGAGTIVAPSGDLVWLSDRDFQVSSSRTWESPHTDGVYPLDWDITISSGKFDFTMKVYSVMDDQEMYNPAQNYWEGACTVEGERNGEAFEGLGYTELSGYASDPLDPKQ